MVTGVENPGPMRMWVLLFFLGLLIVGLAIDAGVRIARDRNEQAKENRARERMRKQIAEVKSGESDVISATTEIDAEGYGFDELVASKNTFNEADDFALHVSYSHDVDAFLQRLSGIRGVSRLYFHKTDVTDAGLVHVATFPHLKNLALDRGGATDKGIIALRDCPQLEELFIEPSRDNAVSIPVLLSLPHLRRLTICSRESSSWVRDSLPHLEQAKQLEKLTLADPNVTAEDVQKLQTHLPNCEIEISTDYGA
jgi:hypothetical protein